MSLDPTAVRDMAERYAAAWSSGSAEAVASFYAEDGQIAINGSEPLVGRAAIAEMAACFYAEFPDLVVHLDDIRVAAGNEAIFVWTLEGKHSETGKQVKLGGWEEWTLTDEPLVSASLGRFDAAEYDRQVAEGI